MEPNSYIRSVMSFPFDSQVSRRAALFGLAAAAASPACAAPSRRVALLGDSISSGYGLPPSQALPAQLEAELARLNVPARVINAARAGETTAGAAARVERDVPRDVNLCVVAVGGNDLLLGAEPAAVRANLDVIVRKLQTRRTPVLLAGVQIPLILGGEYARAFNGAFAQVAQAHGLLFLPDLLAGVALNPRLNQGDLIHPNAQGVNLIARRLAPLVAQGLQAR
jgi:acyl-CoA thioesterase I